MEFGKLNDIAQLDSIPWELPPDDPANSSFLARWKNSEHHVWMGAPAWSHKEWIRKIYPPQTKPVEFLFHYSRYFNTIELNTTHYRIPTLEQVQKWRAQVPDDFQFCPKIFNGISHDPQGLVDSELLRSWWDFLKALEIHRGPCFLQLPPHFDYQHRALLFQFLKMWPDEFPLALEFRHPSWFQNHHLLPALTEYLQSRHIGAVITDVAGRRDVLHTTLSAPFTMIRFIGNNLHPTDFTRTSFWNDKLESWKQAGLKDTYFFVHEPDDILAPDMSESLRTLPYFTELQSRKSYVPMRQFSFDDI